MAKLFNVIIMSKYLCRTTVCCYIIIIHNVVYSFYLEAFTYDSGTMKQHGDDITAGMVSIMPSTIIDGFSMRNHCIIVSMKTSNSIPSQHVTAKHSPRITLLRIYFSESLCIENKQRLIDIWPEICIAINLIYIRCPGHHYNCIALSHCCKLIKHDTDLLALVEKILPFQQRVGNDNIPPVISLPVGGVGKYVSWETLASNNVVECKRGDERALPNHTKFVSSR